MSPPPAVGADKSLPFRPPTHLYKRSHELTGAERSVRLAMPVAAAPGLPDRLKGVHLLAVDDEEDALGLLRGVLESAGAEVTTAGSGAPSARSASRSGFETHTAKPVNPADFVAAVGALLGR